MREDLIERLRREDRYRWLRRKLAEAERAAELVEFNTDMRPELPDAADAAIDQARGKGGGEVA